MKSFIHSKTILSQHKFYKRRSTTSNLAVFQDFLTGNVKSEYQINVIYTDMAKAFDRILHKLLLNKLESFGVTGAYLNWIRSYRIVGNMFNCVIKYLKKFLLNPVFSKVPTYFL